MPQLIAMVIVVVGAMIYMFQTFGGTGDKIEGIAQKTSVITEINNIKNGLKLAARSEHIESAANANTEAVTTLEGLAEFAYFPEQINEQLDVDGQVDTATIYQAISFGADNSLQITMVNDVQGAIPGIFVDLSNGTLAANAGFLEAQIANDLDSIATIDRTATSANAGALPANATGIAARTPAANGDGGTNADGMFIIYFNDFGTTEVVR
ncbi:hypothetical protein ACH5BF_03075 [Arcobacter sp. YIC-464]|uniref:hypothetical protein n=1 Tax=Arcobacter sp. YIC-464 TaxID=3376631 RepID=UPI003C1D07A1